MKEQLGGVPDPAAETPPKIDVESLVGRLLGRAEGSPTTEDRDLRGQEFGTIEAHHRTEARSARFERWPEWVEPRLRRAFEVRGIDQLYLHQRQAADRLHGDEGGPRDTVVATPTASGKSLCYHLPVLDELLRDPTKARALYLFPTKALARDQMAELEDLLTVAESEERRLTVAVYDGDTPPATRRALREAGHLVITNPHMLHSGILPNHTKWQGLFKGLRYVVLDEVHTLSGVYGSHVANVIRRLQRICRHYGSDPVFCACSATISNPADHAKRLLGRPVSLVDEDGSPRGPKHYAFVNPPLVSEASGTRSPALEAARQFGGHLVASGLQSIFFTRSRRATEVLTKYLHDEAKRRGLPTQSIAGYRGGYLPELRRRIERGLRDGSIETVVSTSALELGIDIGSLDVCVLIGYPGTVASTMQRAGRVGRRHRSSLVVMMARSFAIDQFLCNDPGFLFDAPREAVAIDPDNPVLLANHLKCAVFEIPFEEEGPNGPESFGGAEGVRDILDFLCDDLRVTMRQGGRVHWADLTFPAEGVALGTADMDNVVIHDRDTGKVLAEIDRASSITEVYEGAIYGHQGEQYLVEEFRYDDRRAYVRACEVDYFTEADVETELTVLHQDETRSFPCYDAHRVEVHVSTLAKAFKKVRFYTRENVGIGEIDLPPEEFETEACLFTIDREKAHRVGLGEGAEGGGLRGVAELIHGLVPLFVRVDPGDVGVTSELLHPHFERPAITVYDRVPNGVGLSERVFKKHREIFEAALGVVGRCICLTGCPACIGPGAGQGRHGKARALAILRLLIEGE
ncbi:MAG: DEAD/DEAH box helicase [Planctomycetota bacterium]